MSHIVIENGGVEVDAALIARGLQIDTGEVRSRMRDGRITGRLERGVDEDDGRYRLTFTDGRRQLQLITDGTGKVLEQSTTDLDPRRHHRRSRRGPPRRLP